MKRYMSLAGTLCFLLGCSQTLYTVDIKNQAVAIDEIQNKNKCELIYLTDIDVKSIDGRDYSELIEKTLHERGINTVNKEKANCRIIVAYGVKGPYTKTMSAPVYGQTGIVGSTSYTNANAYGWGNYAVGSSTTTTTYTPRYGITGYRSYNVDYYNRYLVFKATDLDDNELWNAFVQNIGTTNNLRDVFPVLAFFAKDSMMTNVAGIVNITERQAKQIYQNMITPDGTQTTKHKQSANEE